MVGAWSRAKAINDESKISFSQKIFKKCAVALNFIATNGMCN